MLNHIDAISKTISRNIGVLTMLKHFVPENILYSLYCTLILPYINYGVLIWGNTCKMYLDKIFKTPENGLSERYQIATTEATPVLCSQNIMFFMFMIYLSSILVHLCTKHHTNQLPPIFSTYFTKHVQTHNYSTRNAQDYSINITMKMFSDCAIRNCGPSFWNSLDKTLKHCKTTKHFRNELKSVLLSVYN